MPDVNDRASAFNFCNPFDTVLPIVDGSVGKKDRHHLWGLSTANVSESSVVISSHFYLHFLSKAN